ncbi:MAG: hypothetical protein HKN76_20935 [Saprospiraceae bacterium]|nr:hypothetical protein [Saprospiraceae bacterium]
MLRATILSLFLSFLILGCYEQKEGCLDVLASNFQFDADVDCCRKDGECCCQYPKLIISVKHQYEGENLSAGKVYHTAQGQPFFIQSIRFLASGVLLIDNSEAVSIVDEIEVETSEQNNIIVPDDFTIFSSTSFSYTIGDFTRPGTYSALQFNVGVDDAIQAADPAQFDADHALAAGSSSVRNSTDQLLLYDIAWIPDTASMQVVNLQATADQLVPVVVPLEGSKSAGVSITIPVVIEYSSWFSDIDLDQDLEEVQKQKILQGLVHSFTVL